MNKFLLALISFSSLAPTLWSQTPSPSPDLFGKSFSYQTKTVWGLVQATVQPQGNGFSLEVKSETPMTGWVLKNESGDQTLGKGGLGASREFSSNIQKPFQGSYRLTVYLNAEQDSVPVALMLGSKTTTDEGTVADVTSEEVYEENPDHPYHAMVRSLYDQAVGDLAKGDRFNALSHLKKAAELDPLQPQVRDLLNKTEGPATETLDPIDQARASWKDGDKEGALNQLDDILLSDPNNEKALALKKEIEGKHKRSHAKPVPETAQPKKAPTPVINEKEAQAKADQAYNLGLESYRRNDYPAAKKFWEDTLQILPTHAQARRNLERLQEDHPELK